ncbi:MAG TPA: DNA repair protein RecN [Cyclobacteriaceae bacterium]|nr:DNA repair protein RecN [Cyclobacteriaceae bacterium]
MLRSITIKNYALIKQLEMNPSSGLSVITGETGAGKSIMLGALGLLMGNRADTKVLWDETEKCVTEGVFDIADYKLEKVFKHEDLDYDDQTVLRREISPNGKSRAFINDTPVTLDVMRRMGSLLMDIHSQHEILLLGNRQFQLNLIDAYAGNQTSLENYTASWLDFLRAKKAHETLTLQAESLRQEADYVSFQLDELEKAELEENEQESLESNLKVMEHAEEIKSKLQQSLELLSRSDYATRSTLAEARTQVSSLASYGQVYAQLHSRIESLLIELDDILNEIEGTEESVEYDPARAETIQERLSTIYRLQKKHNANDIRQLLNIQEELRKKASLTANLDEALAKAKADLLQAETELNRSAVGLSATRKKVFAPLAKELVNLLKELAIPEAQLQIEHNTVAPNATGTDDIEIFFSANKGIAPRPLAQVASGGEFSRLMFCIKYVMAEKTAIPTLILDEIDSGISGEVSIKLGSLMKKMAKGHQLITITHLPQIAAKGDAHYYVFKDNSKDKTISNIKLLNEEERIREIAQMIGGSKPSAVTLQGAKELLNID